MEESKKHQGRRPHGAQRPRRGGKPFGRGGMRRGGPRPHQPHPPREDITPTLNGD